GFIESEKYDFNAEGDQMGHFYVNHGNQPNMQASHLFNYSGKPWLTQKWTRKIQDQFYGDGPYLAWPGDEDQGQMGAYFVMTAMGLFETDGGASVHPIYEINSPLFEKIIIHLDTDYYSGKTFTIIADNVSDKNYYIQSAKLNGKKLDKPWIYHSELVKGGVLRLKMGDTPNKNWGTGGIPD